MLIGIDVGGTNTDAVLMDGSNLVARGKQPTTPDVTSGILSALEEVLRQKSPVDHLSGVMLGTTHFINALLERRELCPTAALRLCLPATQILPPLVDWPGALREAVGGLTYMVPGGHEFDGREISSGPQPGTESCPGYARQGCGVGGGLRSILARKPGARA